MIIRYYRGYISYEKLKELTCVTREGVTAYHIINAARTIGFNAKGVECTLDNITKDNIILPCIANVIMNNSYRHFVVIYEINFKQNYLVIGDPSNKIIKMSFDIFRSIFSGVLIILYPEKVLPISQMTKITPLMIWNIVKFHKDILIQIVISSLLVTLFSIISSFYVENMIQGITNNQSKINLIFIFILFFFIYVIKIIGNFFRDKMLVILTQKIDLVLTLDTFKKVLSLPYHYYRNRTTGDIISRIQDLNTIKGVVGKFIISIIIDIPLSLIACSLLYFINSTLCGIVIIMALLYVVIGIIFNTIFDKYISKEQISRASTNSYMIESIGGFETVKGLNMKDLIFESFEKKYVNYLYINGSYQDTIVLQNLLKDTIYSLGFLIITLIGSFYVLEGDMLIGSLVTFHSLLFYFLDPIQSVLSLSHQWREVKNAIRRVLEIEVSDNKLGFLENTMQGDIEFKSVTYSFNEINDVLKNISFKIKNSEKVMITGLSGSGKSTMLKLLMKYYSINRDMIFINNIDINDYKESKGVYYVNQQEMLFTGSILDNLKGYDENISDDAVVEIGKLCAIDKIISSSNLGYHTIIEENGFNLSGGERQRIILGRALLKPFEILIIDEGTNQIDVDLERKILKGIFKKFKDKTILFISHRNNNLDLFNHLIELSDGNIVKDVIYSE